MADLLDDTAAEVEASPVERLPVGKGKRRRGRPRKSEKKVVEMAEMAGNIEGSASVASGEGSAGMDSGAAVSAAEVREEKRQAIIEAVKEAKAEVEAKVQAPAAVASVGPSWNFIKRNR